MKIMAFIIAAPIVVAVILIAEFGIITMVFEACTRIAEWCMDHIIDPLVERLHPSRPKLIEGRDFLPYENGDHHGNTQ